MNKVTPIDPISKIDLRFRHIYKDPMGFKKYRTKIDGEIESNEESDEKRFISLYKKLQEADIDIKELNKLRNKPKSDYDYSDELFEKSPSSKQIKELINDGRIRLSRTGRPLYHVVLSYSYYPESNIIELLTFPNGMSRNKFRCSGYIKYDGYSDQFYVEIYQMSSYSDDGSNTLRTIDIEV